MASKLEQVGEQIRAIGLGCAKVSGQIHQMGEDLQKQADSVSDTIGGSSSGIDKQMVNSLNEAAKALKEAATALVDVTHNAARWNA